MTCNCYVSKLSDARRWMMYGAHALSCPAYRESRDPVNRRFDRDMRDAAKMRGDIGRDD